jgi:amino acid adenylation domain-containing protein
MKETSKNSSNSIGALEEGHRFSDTHERHRVLQEWNRTAVPYPRHLCIHQIFEAQAERTPEAVALVSEPDQLNYRELNERANQVAHALRESGVRAGSLVGVYLERSVEFVISVLAVLKASGVYLPLDRSYPTRRIQFMLKDSAARVIITRGRLPKGLDLEGVSVLDLSAKSSRQTNGSVANDRQNPGSVTTAEDPAYVIYTSGSTGQPKGVVVPHRGVVRLVCGQNYADFAPGQRFLLLASTSFDATTFELWGPILNGATCVIFPERLQSFEQLEAVIHRQKVTCLWLTAGLFNQIIDTMPAVLSSVTHVLTGGEALSVPHVKRARQLLPQVRLTNGYGPTESTTFACCYPVGDALDSLNGSVPIGRPIANTQIYILDEALRPVPIGTEGELCIGGDGLACGYLNQPKLTEEKFVPDPFSVEPGARLYKTGDLARHLPDGNIEFLGRKDQQVKIRGFRIELGEIEAALAEHPNVSSAVVLAREDAPGNKQLVAYLVMRDASEPSTNDLRAFLGALLPEYMIPNAFVLLEKLPLTSNGKVDRQALPSPVRVAGTGEGNVAGPRTPTESVMTNIWKDLLGVNGIGTGDNFFTLGGHSLMALKLVFRIRDAFGVALTAKEIAACPTLAGLSNAVDQAARIDAAESIKPLPREPGGAGGGRLKFPATFNQQQLWFIAQLAPGKNAYSVPLAIRFHGPMNHDALKSSLNNLIARHEVLRTVFEVDDGFPCQLVLPNICLDLPMIRVDHLPESEAVKASAKLLFELLREPFDLTQGPLVRAQLVRQNDELHVLHFVTHHIVFDGWSGEVLLRELMAGYRQNCGEAGFGLSVPAVQFGDFAVWQQCQLTEAKIRGHLQYWREHLAGVPSELELPLDRLRTATSLNRAGEEQFKLRGDTVAALHEIAHKEEASLFVILLAAFQTLLHRYSRQTQILVGVPFAGRNSSQVEKMIGFFANALPVKADFTGNPCFDELLRQVRDTLWSVQAHEDLPFERLVREMHPVREANRNPLFQVAMVLEVMPSPPPCPPGFKVAFEELPPPEAVFDLTLSVTERDGEMACSLRYNRDLFDAITVQRMIANYLALLSGIITDPKQHTALIPVLSDAERHQVLAQWNQTAADISRNGCVPELFELQATATPDAPAVVFENQKLTYGELNQRANRLAGHLRELGAGPDKLVGLFLERSVELVVGLLGILKAGAAYVPMDPIYPQERLKSMMEDAQPVAMLTQKNLLAALPALPVSVVLVEDFGAEHTGTDSLDVRSLPENLAYVIYTSGSTGKPKGVEITHRALTNFLCSMRQEPGLQARDIMLAVTTISFDIAGLEIFLPLICGACVVVAPASVVVDGVALAQLIKTSGATILQATPATWRLLLESGWNGDAKLKILCGGESWPVTLADKLLPRCCSLWNMYGPTETTIWSTVLQVHSGQNIHIGRPIANTTTFILDAAMMPVPIGCAGELHIGGAGLARGYHNRPDLTAEKFVANPFDGRAGTKLYKTGDLCRYLRDGNIEYLGRIDQQVKIRGFRIELGEIETLLGRHPVIRECVVVARENEAGEKNLVAYLVGRNEPVPAGPELRDFLAQQLPAYMVPSTFVVLEQLPLTPNGKIDRKALPAPREELSSPLPELSAPQSPVETVLLSIWQELLQLQHIGMRDNFFALGGHSLLAMKMVNEIKRRTNCELPVRLLFQHPTIEELAVLLQRQDTRKRKPELVQLSSGNSGPSLFLLIDEGSLGLFKLAPYLSQQVSVFASVVPIPVDTLKAAVERNLRKMPTIEEWAAGHVELILARAGTGPILLGGHCFGGVLAFEVAQRLQAKGVSVGALLLLDTWMASPGFWWEKREWLRAHVRSLFREGFGYLWRKSARRIRLQRDERESKAELVMRNDFNLHVPWAIISRIYEHAMKAYQPKNQPNQAILFVSREDWMAKAFSRHDKTLGAGKYFAGGVEVVHVPGNHVTILEESHLPELASHINRYLAALV